MKSIELIKFLHPLNIKKEKEAWLEYATKGFGGMGELDREKGELKVWMSDHPDKAPEENIISFDDYLLDKLALKIDRTVEEITNWKFNPAEAETIISDRLFNSTISRQKDKLIDRYQSLSDAGFNVPKTLKKLETFVYKQLTNQIIKPKRPYERILSKDSILKLTEDNIVEKLLRPLFQWLIERSVINQSSETAFITFLEGKWDQKINVEWKGKPEELVGLYYALFNKIDDLGEKVFQSRPRYRDLLQVFIVEDEGKRLNHQTIRKYNSNPKNRAFYKKVVGKILELTQKVSDAK